MSGSGCLVSALTKAAVAAAAITTAAMTSGEVQPSTTPWDTANTMSVTAGGNVGTTPKSTLATPFFQDNSDIVDVIYTYNAAPWTITPYFQYTNVPKSAKLGIAHEQLRKRVRACGSREAHSFPHFV